MIQSILACFLFAAISLGDVTGEHLTVRAHFNAHNVRLGDPMTLMIDFVGSAEFTSLHPPALSREVDKTQWKIDDASAKTETTEIARRLIYRVRPLKEGILRFPSLTFSYRHAHEDREIEVTTAEMPVHVKGGAQVVLKGLESEEETLLMPDGICFGVKNKLRDDVLFRWEKACRSPKSSAFCEFDFPEARLNEAACLLLEGNWAKARRIYSALEWRIGQTPAIERGLLATLAAEKGTSAVELPIWRSLLRPVLRFALIGRVLSLFCFFGALVLFFWGASKIIRLFVCICFILLSTFVEARTDPFEEMDRMMQRAFGNMQSFMGVSEADDELPQIKIETRLSTSKESVQVGDSFEYIVTIESPKGYTIDDLRLQPFNSFGMVVLGKIEKLVGGEAENPSNVVTRLSVPVRYDVPFKGELFFGVSGQVSGRHVSSVGSRRHSISFSQPFSSRTPELNMEIKPLPSAGQPADFSGMIASCFSFRQSVDRTKVETNDVVVVTYTLEHDGFLPQDAVKNIVRRQPRNVVWQSYFIADGREEVPSEEFVVYDTGLKEYRRIKAKTNTLMYVASDDAENASDVSVDSTGEVTGENIIKLHFAPSKNSPVTASVSRNEIAGKNDECGAWVRVETSSSDGWINKEDYK